MQSLSLHRDVPPAAPEMAMLESERRQQIEEHTQSDELLQEQHRILELTARGEPVEHRLEQLCLGIERLDPRVRACVLLANDTRSGFGDVFAPSLPAFAEAMRGRPIGDGWGGTCARALVSGKPVASADIADDPRWRERFESLCLVHGIRAGVLRKR